MQQENCGIMVRPPRFERGAFGFGGQRSIQLSYGRITIKLTSDSYQLIAALYVVRPAGVEPCSVALMGSPEEACPLWSLPRIAGESLPCTPHVAGKLPSRLYRRTIMLFYIIYGTPGRSRTCDIRIRSPTLYPAELRAQINCGVRTDECETEAVPVPTPHSPHRTPHYRKIGVSDGA
jgi:hypothetical protein